MRWRAHHQKRSQVTEQSNQSLSDRKRRKTIPAESCCLRERHLLTWGQERIRLSTKLRCGTEARLQPHCPGGVNHSNCSLITQANSKWPPRHPTNVKDRRDLRGLDSAVSGIRVPAALAGGGGIDPDRKSSAAGRFGRSGRRPRFPPANAPATASDTRYRTPDTEHRQR